MRFAYADPPYYGQCAKYNHYHPDGLCWDERETHRLLVKRLTEEFPDGWALSLSSPSLRIILPHCPLDVRVAVWCKSFCVFKKGVRPAYAWEPVIFRGGRNPMNGHKHPPPVKGGKQTTPKDFIVEPITLQKGLTGAKPERFCRWVLQLLNAQEDDEVIDLFPGTGIMGRVVTMIGDGYLLSEAVPTNNNIYERKAALNYKLVLKTYAQLRQLTDDETALLNTLRGMSDAEREMTVEAFGGSMGKQSSKASKVKTTRVIEKCAHFVDGGTCNLTRRARIHHDSTVAGYHEFEQSLQSPSKPKSARASSLASAIKRTVDGNKPPQYGGFADDTDMVSDTRAPLLCDYEIDGKTCHGEENDGIHDKSLGYGGYHPFSPSSIARNAVGQSSTSGDEVSSEVETASA